MGYIKPLGWPGRNGLWHRGDNWSKDVHGVRARLPAG